jgi:hypothetical protein
MAAKLKDHPTEENIVLLITIGSLRIAVRTPKRIRRPSPFLARPPGR